MPIKDIGAAPYSEETEALRRGTRAQYESDWVNIVSAQSHTFQHNLGEVPWVVNVLRSIDSTGSVPRVCTVKDINEDLLNGIDGEEILDYLEGSVTWDPGNHTTGNGETTSLTVTGAAIGDFVLVSAPYDLQDATVTGYVQAADTVELRMVVGDDTTPLDLASGTWTVRVIKATKVSVPAITTADISITYGDIDGTAGTETSHLRVTNETATTQYFKLRAM